MARQDTENLFRRYKGQPVDLKMISGSVHRGRIGEITNDYVSLIDPDTEASIFIFFSAIESIVIKEVTQ